MMRIEAAAESKRISGIRKVCAGKHPEIEAAIEEGRSVTKRSWQCYESNAPRPLISRQANRCTDAKSLKQLVVCR